MAGPAGYAAMAQRVRARTAGMALLLLFALAAFLTRALGSSHLFGIILASALFVLPPGVVALLVLKRWPTRRALTALLLIDSFITIAGYTAIMYSVGGIEATYLLPIYAATTAYDGITISRRAAIASATVSALLYACMVGLEYFGFLPHHNVIEGFSIPGMNQLMIVLTNAGLLFVVALIASYAARLLREQRDGLARRNVELHRAMLEVRTANDTKSRLLARVSHEFRTPLTHIMGFTSLAADKRTGDLNKTQREYLDDVLGSSKHLLSLVEDLLDVSKAEAGKLELELREIEIPGFLAGVISVVEDEARKQRIRIALDTHGAPETIRADERKLKQIVLNLLSNAVKFTPDGGIVRVVARRSEAPRQGGEPWWELCVTDSGVGVKPEDRERIFQPFAQAGRPPRPDNAGTGLGLSLSKHLVELHGGRIWVESAGEGQGSTFRFVIPTPAHPCGATAAEPAPGQSP